MLPLDFILFLQIIIFLFITPGTPRIVIVSYSMNYGVQKCVWTALGDITANFIQATLVIFVLGTFFSDNPTFLNIIKWIGVIYLLYLAYDVYKSSPKERTDEIPKGATLKQGTVLNNDDDPVIFTKDNSGNTVGENRSTYGKTETTSASITAPGELV